MTTDNHTPITTGAPANASTFNSPMGELDSAIGNLSTLDTTEKGSAVGAINEVSGAVGDVQGDLGDLDDLDTTEKGSAVGAINEVAGSVGDVQGDLGDLDDLDTTIKSSLVAALNEALSKIAVGKKNAYTEIISRVAYEIDADVSYLQVNYVGSDGTIRLPAIADVGLGTEITIRDVSNDVNYVVTIQAASGSGDGIEGGGLDGNIKLTYRACLDPSEDPKWYFV